MARLVLKLRQQAQNGVTYAKPHVTKPSLSYSFGCPRNGNFNHSVQNPQLSTSEIICLKDP